MKPIRRTPADVNPLAGSAILTQPVEKMTVEERTQAHVVLKYLESKIKQRLEQIREPLLADAERHGEKLEKSHRLFVEGTEVRRQTATAKEPDFQKFTDLLASKHIEVTGAYDKIENYAYNESKVQILVSRGQLSQKEVDACRKVTVSLVVDASAELKLLLDEAAKEYAPPKLAGTSKRAK